MSERRVEICSLFVDRDRAGLTSTQHISVLAEVAA